MKKPQQAVKVLDYRQTSASNKFVPQPAKLSSKDKWQDIHFELHQQPRFETLEHQHTMHVIAIGSGFSNISGERWLDGKMQTERRNRGDIAIIPASIAHRCNWNNLAEFGILAVEHTLLKQLARDLVDEDRIVLIPQFMNETDELITGIFATLKDELESPKLGCNFLIDNLKTTLAIHLLRKYCITKPKLSIYQDGLSKSRLKRVTEYIHEHLDSDLKIVELAAIAQMSPYYFIRLFRQNTGKTPHQYILLSRIKKAKSLLQNCEPNISEIAARVGFCDQSHLTKYFKRIVGMTPKQYIKTMY